MPFYYYLIIVFYYFIIIAIPLLFSFWILYLCYHFFYSKESPIDNL